MQVRDKLDWSRASYQFYYMRNRTSLQSLVRIRLNLTTKFENRKK